MKKPGPNLCISYSTHQGQLFQELALVTRLHTPGKVSLKRGYFPIVFLQEQSKLLLCLCQAYMHYANLSTRHKRWPIGDQYDNGVCITMRQWDRTPTCMFYGLFNYCTLPSVFTEEILYFLRFFTFFLEKIKDYCLSDY